MVTENNSTLFTDAQSYIQKTRSSMDHLAHFKTFVRERSSNGKHIESIFFELQKAYDTIWKSCFMKDLHDMDPGDVYPSLIHVQYFLFKRKLRVRVGITLSDFYDLEIRVLL